MHLKNKGKYKRNLVSYWALENPILADGEIIVVETLDGSTRLKVGDGYSTYGELPYMDEDEGVESTISQYGAQIKQYTSEPVVNESTNKVTELVQTQPIVNLKNTFINEHKLGTNDVTLPNPNFTDIFATKEKLNPTLLKKTEDDMVRVEAKAISETPSQEEVVVEAEVKQEVVVSKPKRTRRTRKPRVKVEAEV